MIKELNPKARFLMGPGPSDVHSRVYKAMSTPMLGHLDPQFIQIMDEVMEMTRSVYQTTERDYISYFSDRYFWNGDMPGKSSGARRYCSCLC